MQTATILLALPFVVVMLPCWASLKELCEDPGAGLARHHGLLQ